MLTSHTIAIWARVLIDGIVSPLWIRDMDELVTFAMCASAFCSVVLAAE